MSDPALGANLVRFRTRCGLTQVDVARRAGLSRVGYRAIEQGESSPRLDSLTKIAAALGVAVTDLLEPALVLSAVRFRASPRMKNRAQVVANVARWLCDYAELEQTLGHRRHDRLKKVINGLKDKEGKARARAAAAAAREALRLGRREAIRDMCGLLEDRAGVKLYRYALARNDFFGLSVADAGFGRAIVVNVWERITVERWIFTAAHELGHLLLHPGAYDVSRRREEPAAEAEADEFAGHFLMPEELFRSEWEETGGLSLLDRVLKVKRIFYVSWRAVLRRAFPGTKEWDVVVENEYAARAGRRLGPKDEPLRLSPAAFMSDRLERLVREAITGRAISVERGSEILGIEPAEMRKRMTTW